MSSHVTIHFGSLNPGFHYIVILAALPMIADAPRQWSVMNYDLNENQALVLSYFFTHGTTLHATKYVRDINRRFIKRLIT